MIDSKERENIKCYFKTRAFGANGEKLTILLKGVWNGSYFSSFDEKGLETRVHKKEWIFTLQPLSDNDNKE